MTGSNHDASIDKFLARGAITYYLCRLNDGRVLFTPAGSSLAISPPSHTFPDETAARWFVKGWHYAKQTEIPGPDFKIEIE